MPHEHEIERSAFNAAFYELGLRWHWDDSTWAELAADPCERARIRRYVESTQPHLLRAYDADFLTDAILTTKARCKASLAPGVAVRFDNNNWTEVGF